MALTAADPCGHRARSAGVDDYNLITNHKSLEAASDTDALQQGRFPSIPTASAEDAEWAEALVME